MARLLCLASLALAAASLTPTADAQRPLGVDVSSYQGGSFNWAGEKSSGVTFGWAKATEGTYDDDSDFVVNENNGKAAGIFIGAYHFARPDLTSPSAEANFFWAAAGNYIKNDGKTAQPALDLETFNGVVGASSYSAWANAWGDIIINDADAKGVKVRPVLYCSTCQVCNFNSSSSGFIPWIANPSGESAQTGTPWGDTPCPDCAADVWGSGVWDVWQYGGSSVDLDVFNGTASDMKSVLVVDSGGTTTTTNYASCVGPIVMNSDGRLEMFAVGTNSHVWHNYQNNPNGQWNGWIDLANGNSIAPLAVSHDLDGRLEIFAATGSGKVWHNYQTQGGGGAWNGWANQAGPGLTNLIALTNLDGRVEVYGIGTNGDAWHEWQTSANGSWTTSWADITGEKVKGGMVGIANADGRLELFAVGANGDVWHNWQTSPGQVFHGWADSGGAGMNPRLAIAQNADGRLEIFALGTNGDIWHNYQTTPGQVLNGWIDFGGLNGVKPGFVVGINKDGRLEMFGVGSNNDVWHVWQDEPGSRWHTWADLGGSGQNAQLTLANNQDGEIQLFDIGNNSEDVWSIYQNSPGGSWNSWFDMGGNGMMYYYGQP